MTKVKYPKRSSEDFARSKARQDLMGETVRLALGALNAAHERREKEKTEKARGK